MSIEPTKSLAESHPKKLVQGVAKIWHWGEKFMWSPVFEEWVATNETVTIRPGDQIPADVAVIDA